jgi:hypothetical protein
MIAIGAAVTLPIVLPSEEYRLSRAQQLIESDSVVDWSEARSILEPIIRSESELADEAEQAYFESRRKTLVYRAEKGKSTRIDSDNEQKFAKAVALQLTGDNQDAVNFFSELIKLVDPEGDERHIYFESQDRYQQLSKELVWPTEPIDLLDKIMETKTAKSESELIKAQAMLGELTIKFASESKYKNVVEVAAERLQQIKLALVELRSNDN